MFHTEASLAGNNGGARKVKVRRTCAGPWRGRGRGVAPALGDAAPYESGGGGGLTRAADVCACGQALCSLLGPISRAKYPDLSEEEERISLPLQARRAPSLAQHTRPALRIDHV